MVKLSDGLIKFFEDHIEKLIIVTLKDLPSGQLITGYLKGFDNSVILLNPVFDSNGKFEKQDAPLFIDLDSIATITSPNKEGFESYEEAFKEFKREYELQKKRMSAMDTAETT